MLTRRLKLCFYRRLKSYRCLVTAAVLFVVTATCLDLLAGSSSLGASGGTNSQWGRFGFDRPHKADLLRQRLIDVCVKTEDSAMAGSSPGGLARAFADGVPFVENNIYWSREIEQMIPRAPSVEEMFDMADRLRSSSVVDMSVELPPDCEHSSCSSPQNAIVTMNGDRRAYVRYKPSCWVYGDVMAFYFSVLLCMNSVPAVILARPSQWTDQSVQRTIMNKTEWEPGSVVSMMAWIDNSTESFQLPRILLEGVKFIHPDNPIFADISLDEMALLAQYTDMMLFDYLTGNNDRVVYHLFYWLVKNVTTTSETHNLQVDQSNAKLWLVDNEVSFGIGYDFVKDNAYNISYFFTEMLRSACIFRRGTIARILSLRRQTDTAKLLWEILVTHDALADVGHPWMTCQADDDVSCQIEWASMLEQRIDEVLEWVTACQRSSYSDLNSLRTTTEDALRTKSNP